MTLSKVGRDIPLPRRPAFDGNLDNKWLEVLWRYTDKQTKERVLIWSPVRVVAVADGVSHKRTPRCKKLMDAGALLVEWEADAEFEEESGRQWLVLDPKNFNGQRQNSWRWDPRELAVLPSPAPARTARDWRADGESPP